MFRKRRYWFEPAPPRKERSDKGERRTMTETLDVQVTPFTLAVLRPDKNSLELVRRRSQSDRALQALCTCYGLAPPHRETDGVFTPLWVDRSRFACEWPRKYPPGERVRLTLRLPTVWCNWLRAQPVGPGAVIDDAVLYALVLGCTAPLPLERDRLASLAAGQQQGS